VEAAVATGNGRVAQRFIEECLSAAPDSALRNRLVPMLVSAGAHDRALEECRRRRLSDRFARRLLIYRLAVAGQPALALEQAEGLRGDHRAEALADIALAAAPRPEGRRLDRKVVGVSLHGSWRSWFPRLERMGLPWELMPFVMPYEVGSQGLAARYSMLGYPGTGGHIDHVAVPGLESIRGYLYSGGGFLGICAGQFLATREHLAACDTTYLRGKGPHQVQIRKDHPVAAGLPPVVIIQRQNGGMLMPRPGCEVIGWYDTIGRFAALVATRYGAGRVVAFSPHPEGSSGFVPRDRLCIHAIHWAIGGVP
jgi:hypothetical protein